jgi:hypothetical protein
MEDDRIRGGPRAHRTPPGQQRRARRVGSTAGPQVLLGASAAELAQRVTVPLAVIRDIPPTARPTSVVIGVDCSPAGARAAQAGFDVAARRHLRVVAVHAWSDLPAEAVGIRTDLDDEQGREDGADLLTSELAKIRARYRRCRSRTSWSSTGRPERS